MMIPLIIITEYVVTGNQLYRAFQHLSPYQQHSFQIFSVKKSSAYAISSLNPRRLKSGLCAGLFTAQCQIESKMPERLNIRLPFIRLAQTQLQIILILLYTVSD